MVHQKRPRSPGALFAYFRARDTQEGITACAASQAGGPHVPGLPIPACFPRFAEQRAGKIASWREVSVDFPWKTRYNGTRMRREGSLWWDAGSGGSGERAEDGARERRYDRVGSGRYKRLAGTAVSPAASPARNSGLGTGPAGAGVCGGAFGAADASGERIRGLPSADVPGRARSWTARLGGWYACVPARRPWERWRGSCWPKAIIWKATCSARGSTREYSRLRKRCPGGRPGKWPGAAAASPAATRPGEGTLDLSCQKTLLEAFGDVPEVRGITLTPGLMLRPERSMLYVFGADPDYPRRSVEHDCGMCPREGCLYRRTGFGKMGTGTKTGPEERKCTEYAW